MLFHGGVNHCSLLLESDFLVLLLHCAAFAMFLFMIVVTGVIRRSEPPLKRFLLSLRPMFHFCLIFVLSLAIMWHWHENCVVITFVIITASGVENVCSSVFIIIIVISIGVENTHLLLLLLLFYIGHGTTLNRALAVFVPITIPFVTTNVVIVIT